VPRERRLLLQEDGVDLRHRLQERGEAEVRGTNTHTDHIGRPVPTGMSRTVSHACGDFLLLLRHHPSVPVGNMDGSLGSTDAEGLRNLRLFL
jgi:hypothetical protein